MSVAAYAWGVLVLGGSIWLLGATAAVVSRRLELAASPALHVLSCISLVLCWIYTVSYLLGAVGAFRALPLFLVVDGGALLVLSAARHTPGRQPSTSRSAKAVPADDGSGTVDGRPDAGEAETAADDEALAADGRKLSPAGDNGPQATGRRAPWDRDPAGNVNGAAWSIVVRGAAVIGVVLVVAAFLPATAHSYRHGILEPDSTWYHGHFVGRFLQTGWLTRITPVGTDALVPFHPLNRELLDAVLVLPWRRDLLLPLVSLAGLGLLLLAGWCVGSRSQRGPLGLLATALIASPATIRLSQPGSLKNDLTATAFLAAGAALLVHCERRLPRVALAGAMLGLAAGTRANLLLPIAVLALAATWSFLRNGGTDGRAPAAIAEPLRPSDHVDPPEPAHRPDSAAPTERSGLSPRWLLLATWMGSIAVFGSYWYLRNWIRVGNPLPWTELSLGPVGFDAVGDGDQYLEQTMLHYRDDPELFSAAIRPGLDMAFGTNLWWAWGLLAVASIGLAVARRSWLLVGMVTAGWLGVLVHPALPLSLSVEPTSPLAAAIVASTTRYLIPAVALILLAGAAATRSRAAHVGWALATLVLLALGLRPNALLDSTSYDGQTADIPLAIGLGVALAVPAGLVFAWPRLSAHLSSLTSAGSIPSTALPRLGNPPALRSPPAVVTASESPALAGSATPTAALTPAESTSTPGAIDPVVPAGSADQTESSRSTSPAEPSPGLNSATGRTASAVSIPPERSSSPTSSGSEAGWTRAPGWGQVVRVAVLVVPVVVLAALGFPLFDHYLDERYAAETSVHGGDLWGVTRDLRDTRIGMATTAVPYPYLGADFSNEVEYIGVGRSGGLLRNAETCSEWTDEIIRRQLTHVALTPDPVIALPTTTLQEWTLAIPGTRILHGADGRALIQMPADPQPPPPGSCP